MDTIQAKYPKTIEEAVDILISSMPEGDREKLINMPEEDLINLHFGWGDRIRNAFGLWEGNEELLKACGSESGNPDGASMVIIRAAWKRLRSN